METYCWATHAGYSHCLMAPGHDGGHTDINTGRQWHLPSTTGAAA